MLDKFLNDLEELLHSKPLDKVDISELVYKYTLDKSEQEIESIRISISGLLTQLETANLIQLADNYRFILNTRIYGQYQNDPIYVKGTIKFENDYKEKRKPPLQPITYNTTHGHNSPIAGNDVNFGDINQPLSDLSTRPEINPITNPTNINEITSKKNRNSVTVIWEYISNNALIAGILAAIFAALILLNLFGHF